MLLQLSRECVSDGHGEMRHDQAKGNLFAAATGWHETFILGGMFEQFT